MATINPYLFFPGNTEEAFNFYKSVFGGEFLMLSRYEDSPENPAITADHKNQIMHIALPIGRNILMGSDAVMQGEQAFKFGDNTTISVDTDNLDEAERIYRGLSEGGNVEMPLQKMFWGAWFSMFKDKFGAQWMVNYDENKTTL
ncbi:MAG: VOC family protein [Bacteroidota bacterium]